MERIGIFDYDDTLASSQDSYGIAQAKLTEFIITRLGWKAPGAPEIINKQVEIDMGLTSEFGFTKKRFPTSFKRTYREMAKKVGIFEDIQGEGEAYELGARVFDPKQWNKRGLIEGARDALDFLQNRGDELILLTKGDPEIQYEKIIATGVKRWFGDRIHIVGSKTPEKFAELAAGRSEVYSVGNGRGDILPALEVGIRGFYIPQSTWAYEDSKGISIDHPNCVTLDCIEELIHECV